MARSLADKSNNDRFRLRLATVMKKADELRSYDAEIYILVRRRAIVTSKQFDFGMEDLSTASLLHESNGERKMAG
jgi:hypothetical protein